MVFAERRKVEEQRSIQQAVDLELAARAACTCCPSRVFSFLRNADGRFHRFAVAILSCASANNARKICLNLHLGKERLQITSGLSLGGGPSSDYVIGILISLDMQLMRGTKG